MSAFLQPENHSGTDFPGHPELSQLNEVAAACEFQDCLQNQSKVCLDIIWITRISAVLGPFLCWKAILMDVDKYVLSLYMGLVVGIPLSEVTHCYRVKLSRAFGTPADKQWYPWLSQHFHSMFGLSFSYRKSNKTSCGYCSSHRFALWQWKKPSNLHKLLVPGYSKGKHLTLFKIYFYRLYPLLCLHKIAEAVTQQVEE